MGHGAIYLWGLHLICVGPEPIWSHSWLRAWNSKRSFVVVSEVFPILFANCALRDDLCSFYFSAPIVHLNGSS